jgi:hypothetical protein
MPGIIAGGDFAFDLSLVPGLMGNTDIGSRSRKGTHNVNAKRRLAKVQDYYQEVWCDCLLQYQGGRIQTALIGIQELPILKKGVLTG